MQEVVAADEELQAGRGRMLVFARDVASAEATADALEGACGLPVLRYHKVGHQQGERVPLHLVHFCMQVSAVA